MGRACVRIRDGDVQLPELVHVVQDVYEAEREDGDHVKRQRQQKQEEVAVVSPPDAVVHPGTVMVEILGGGNPLKSEHNVKNFAAMTHKKKKNLVYRAL